MPIDALTILERRPAAWSGVEVTHPLLGRHDEILGVECLAFVAELHRRFEARRRDLLRQRVERQVRLDAGELPVFPPQTETVRRSPWRVASIPDDLRDRRVEITGPADRKMIINALNSGANVFMADFEDAHAPTWANTLDGQVNLYDAVRRTISHTTPDGRHYELHDRVATLMVRPRGWHLTEKHVVVDGEPVSGSLFDFGVFFFHNAAELINQGTGPYVYLPKLEGHQEARLWNDVFLFAQERLGVPRGTTRATVLIENVLAAFEMDEILWELREHAAGLNCGRWDYIFSYIKKLRAHPHFILPDRGAVTMDRHFLRSYVELLIRTCHRRGIHAMGGMAAQVPVKDDPAANAAALGRVRQDKLREVRAGHDGTWVAHPGLVPVAREVFNRHMPAPHQIDRSLEDVHITPADLLEAPGGQVSERGLRHNVDVGIQYLEAWLRGVGCVPIYNLMEDAATAEISRSQVWQWVQHGAPLEDGRTVTLELVRGTIAEELSRLRSAVGAERFDSGKFTLAAKLFDELVSRTELPEWLTTVAYDYLE